MVIDDYGNLDRVVEAAAANPDQRILVDLAAQTHHALARWIDDSGLIDLAPEVGLSITYKNQARRRGQKSSAPG